jgi:hypothetical protein
MTASGDNRTQRGRGPLEIVIRSNGQVVFRTFTDEMLSIAAELAPHDPRVCDRIRRRERARKRGES